MTEPLGPPHVDPLPDAAWTRIERGLWERMDHEPVASAARPRRIAVWIAAPLVAIAACVALWLGFAPRGTQVAQHTPDETARVVAGATPSAVSFGDAHITLDAASALVMEHEATQPTALLEYGAAWFSVAPRGDRPPFEVRAGDAIVRVIGTRFRVARDGEHVEVAVDHGVVEVRFRGSLVTLTAQHSWSSAKPTEIAIATPPSEPTVDPTALPSGIADGRAQVPAIDSHAAITPPTAPVPVPDLVGPTHPVPPPAVDADRARYDELQRLEATRPDAAITGYLELSKGSGKWAQIGLFAAGRLAVDRHDARAKSLLTIYLKRFPRGANAADAQQLLNRLDGGTR